jgi:hypothetical protein
MVPCACLQRAPWNRVQAALQRRRHRRLAPKYARLQAPALAPQVGEGSWVGSPGGAAPDLRQASQRVCDGCAPPPSPPLLCGTWAAPGASLHARRTSCCSGTWCSFLVGGCHQPATSWCLPQADVGPVPNATTPHPPPHASPPLAASRPRPAGSRSARSAGYAPPWLPLQLAAALAVAVAVASQMLQPALWRRCWRWAEL